MSLPRTRTGRPILKRTSDVIPYWIERAEQVAPEGESFEKSSMICRGDRLFHYGSHFELARIIRDKRGRTRLVLLNGDTWNQAGGFGPTTSSRQREVRSAVRTAGLASMTVPFSAIEAAGIDFSSIGPIHVRDDRSTPEHRESRTRPAKLAKMEDPSGATKTEERWGWSETERKQVWGEHEVPVYVENPERTVGFPCDHGYCTEGATLGDDGVWRWDFDRHWLGDSIFRARSTEHRTRKATAEELAAEERYQAWAAEANRLTEAHMQLARRGQHHWRRHVERTDYGHVFRLQFAVEGLWQAREKHRETQPPRTQVRDGRVPITVTRWATFLSSFDYQEARPLYFLCELPRGTEPATVEEAIERLKPPEVAAAEARGVSVTRQGDLFAVPTKLTTQQLGSLRGRHKFTKRLRILGTNHSVTEGIICKGGAVLGRGIMRHEPDGWRQPDHARQRLGDGKTWHLLVRNTVPRAS